MQHSPSTAGEPIAVALKDYKKEEHMAHIKHPNPKSQRGSALVLAMIVILVGTLLFSYLLKRSNERRESAGNESARRAATLLAAGRLETVKQTFMTDLQAAIGLVQANPNMAANIQNFQYNNHPLLQPQINLPAGDSFSIQPIAQGTAGSGSFKYEVKVDNVLPKIFSVTYQARSEKGVIARVTHKIQVNRSTLNNFAIAYHSQPQPVSFAGPFTANGQVAMMFTQDQTGPNGTTPGALSIPGATGEPLIKLNTTAGDIEFNSLVTTNAPQTFSYGNQTHNNLQVVSGTNSANFSSGVAYAQGGDFSGNLLAMRSSLLSTPNVNGILSGENVSYSKVYIWKGAQGETNYKVEVYPVSVLYTAPVYDSGEMGTYDVGSGEILNADPMNPKLP